MHTQLPTFPTAHFMYEHQERQELKMCVCVCLHLLCIAYTGEVSRLAVHTVRLSTIYHFWRHPRLLCTSADALVSTNTNQRSSSATPPHLSHGLLDSRVACIAWTAASISASFSLASIFSSPCRCFKFDVSEMSTPVDITIDEKGVAATSLEDDPAPAPRTTVDTPAASSTGDPFCEKSTSPPFARRVAGVWSAVAVLWAGVKATAEAPC